MTVFLVFFHEFFPSLDTRKYSAGVRVQANA